MTEVKTIAGITIAQSLHVACVISIGSPSWFKREIFPVLRMHIYLKRRDTWKRNQLSMQLCLKHVSMLVRAGPYITDQLWSV